MTDPALFGPPPDPPGPTVAAMTQSIAQWRALGRLLSPIQTDALMTQALAVDRARVSMRPTAMSGAMNVLVSMLDKFKLAATADPPPADDPFTKWLGELAEPEPADPPTISP